MIIRCNNVEDKEVFNNVMKLMDLGVLKHSFNVNNNREVYYGESTRVADNKKCCLVAEVVLINNKPYLIKFEETPME